MEKRHRRGRKRRENVHSEKGGGGKYKKGRKWKASFFGLLYLRKKQRSYIKKHLVGVYNYIFSNASSPSLKVKT